MPKDIRKWFTKGSNTSTRPSTPEKPPQPGKLAQGVEECFSGRRKMNKKYFAKDDSAKDEMEVDEVSAKKKPQKGSTESGSNARAPPVKKVHKLEDDDDDDSVTPTSRKGSSSANSNKKLKSTSGKGVARKKENDADDVMQVKFNSRAAGRRDTKVSTGDEEDMDDVKPVKAGGRGRGGGKSAPAGGRGRGFFMNFGERKDPPHQGEKEVPEGAASCLDGLTFVITGTLDSLEREEAKDLIKRHGGRVTESVSKKTNYLLCDDDIGGRKSENAKELGTAFLTENGLFDLIRASNKTKPKTPAKDSKKPVDKVAQSPLKKSPQKPENSNTKGFAAAAVSSKQKSDSTAQNMLPWNEKYRPKDLKEVVGNQSMVKQLQDWLESWNDRFLNTGKKAKGKKQNNSGAKKAVLLSGTPGIGKTTSAKLVSKILGFQTIEVNASDSRGKADAKIEKGIGGSTSNSIKELVSNQSLSLNIGSSHLPKTVLIMDEVDGMSTGDRGGVADLIASIKMSKIPIICICSGHYSQKLQSLVNHCRHLNFRKPQKQQIAKRLLEVARLEGLKANEIEMEELAERVNGDIRMAVNQLQYICLSMSVNNSDDIEQRLQSRLKDEDISPFTAADKLFGFNAGKLGMDERIHLSMSDRDIVSLIIQENYINYRSSGAGKDDNEMKRMSSLARAAESIGDGDIVNVQIRRYGQWKLSSTSCLASCIIPAALLHGQRTTFEQGERNCNRFGGWLGKNSTMRKNYRLLEDLQIHLLASRESSNSGRATLRLDYLTLLLKRLTDPLKTLPKDEGVKKVVEFMDLYSISMEDFDTIVEMSKFKGHPKILDGIQPAVKAALTRAYKKGSSSRVVRAADFITLPGIKKAPKNRRIAAMLEPIDDNEEETPSDAEDQEEEDDLIDPEKKLHSNLESLNSKAIRVQMELKAMSDKKRGRGSWAASASKRKR